MPLSGNPNATADFWLKVDESLPLDKRPIFLVKYMRSADFDRHRELMAKAVASKDNAESYALWKEALKVGIAGWERLNFPNDGKPVPFDFDALLTPGLLTEREAWELAHRYPLAVRPTQADLGNSESPAPSGGAQAVETAQQEGV